jgi:hypothetical protein
MPEKEKGCILVIQPLIKLLSKKRIVNPRFTLLLRTWHLTWIAFLQKKRLRYAS